MRSKRRNIASEHDEDGELWLVSYADMVTLLLGFFIILYSMSNVDERKLEEIGKSMSQSFGQQAEKVKAENKDDYKDRQLRAFQLLLSAMQLGADDQGLKTVEDALAKTSEAKAQKAAVEALVSGKDELLRLALTAKASRFVELQVPASLLFAPGTATLSKAAKTTLAELSATLKLTRVKKVEVTGHTDATPPRQTAMFLNNWALSSARAGAVVQVLIDNGVAKNILATRGMADLEPLFPETVAGEALAKNRERNRRVQIRLEVADDTR